MTQEGLFRNIIDTTCMNVCNSNRSPTTKKTAGRDDKGESIEDHWGYRSVIDILLYLSTNTLMLLVRLQGSITTLRNHMHQ